MGEINVMIPRKESLQRRKPVESNQRDVEFT